MFDGKSVENKGKLILTEIFPSMQNMILKSIGRFTSLYKILLNFQINK